MWGALNATPRIALQFLSLRACAEESIINESESEWKKDRKKKIKNKDKIVINLSNFKEIFSSSHSFLVSFTQSYESSNFKDTVIKHLLITKINNELKISGEFVIR